MNDVLHFMEANKHFTFGILIFCGLPGLAIVAIAIVSISHAVLFIPKAIIRHLNLRKAGWPPPHVDADGDWRS
jgi:hypothetical protein